MQYKVMTTEEKAKAYDEALGRAKEKYAMFEGMKQGDVLEDVFPELKGSQDEKIRKALVEMVHDTTGDSLWVDYNIHKEDAISWLEKQGEKKQQTPQWMMDFLDDNRSKFASLMEDYDEQREVEGKLLAIISWLERQGEQKSFDYENANIQQKDFAPQVDMPRYNIGDVLCDKSCTTLSKESQPNFEITDIRNGMYICDKCSFPISQQDEYELVAKRIGHKLAWSEEDEGHIDSLLKRLEGMCKPGATFTSTGFTISEDEDWLKSLRPQNTWKPSDKQMDALSDINCTGCISYAGQGQELINLYNDLKNLREE